MLRPFRLASPAVFLLALSLAWAASARAAVADAELQRLQELLDAWRIDEARELAGRALRESPRSAAALDLDAWVKFYEGRYPDAVQSLERALALDSKNERRQAMRLFAQQTHDVVRSLKRYESEHFIVYLDERRDGILAPYALDALEKSYRSIGAELGYFPRDKVRVEIAPDAAAFNAISTLSLRDIEQTGAVGICKFNKLMIISPRALAFGYRWVDSLSHEYLHYVIVALSDNKAPIWIHEGAARFYETRWRRPEPPGDAAEDYLTPANQTLLVRALEHDKFVGFRQMEPSLIHLDSPEQVQLAYAEAASAIDFINRRKGKSGARELLAALRDAPAPSAIERVLGLSFETFEKQWKEFLKSKGLKEIEGSRVRHFKVKKNGKEDEEVVELREIQSEVARNRTRLADQMLARGRVLAAANEYQRALQASPHSPIILNKLGRVLIQMNRHGEALSHLRKALQLDPDNAGTYVQLGSAYRAAKDHRAAREMLEEALQINPFNPTIYRLLIEIYTALGDPGKSREAKAALAKLAAGN
ncbi:MAG TPA: tetratricopeptide repeat protein [candidate division Zixibacteria bacterium]|nr:tetratricopeptide repeat protein [candidate division Zixibacteria bacterium]